MGLDMMGKKTLIIAYGLSLDSFAGACSIFRTIEPQYLASMENYVYDTAGMFL
jgi:hypothetical protein